MDQNIQIFTAKWVLPISKNPIENGAVAIRNNEIIGVDSIGNITSKFSGKITDLGNSIIFPGFVNVHTHLEHGKITEKVGSYLDFLTKVKTEMDALSKEIKQENIHQNILKSIENGVVAIADFSSDGESAALLLENPIYARVFHEMNELKAYRARDVFNQHKYIINDFHPDKSVTQHFAYNSVWRNSAELLREISVKEQHISVHMAVTEEEQNFLMTGEGRLKQFLLNQNEFDYSFQAPGESPFMYFMNNHFFSKHNILIHMLHVNELELKKINDFQTKINICICPRSVEVLNLKKPDVQMFLRNNINVCLGTESPALIPDLDMRRELIKCIDDFHIRPEIAMKFACLNGAYAIGYHREVGSLDPGKTARCLYINIDSEINMDPYEAILSSGDEANWLTENI
ncbi:MAG: amidohydrolase family protein [Candidatus Marinimicrobia bacterium]|nr:amidohydrolase family protein [Candidatus Neomarinimicrobiota bacterium]